MPEPTSDAWTQIRYDYEHTNRPIEDICAEHGISSGTLRDRVRRWRWTRRRAPIPREGPPAMVAPQREMTCALPQQDSAAPSPWPLGPRLRGDERGDVAKCEPGWGDFRVRTVHPTPTVFAGAQTVDPPPPGEGVRDDRAAMPQSASAAKLETDPAAIAPRLQSAVARVLPAIETVIARLAAGPLHPREMEQAARALGTLTRTLRELNALLAQHPARAAYDDDDMPEDIDAFRIDLARRIEAFVASRAGEEEDAAQPGGDP